MKKKVVRLITKSATVRDIDAGYSEACCFKKFFFYNMFQLFGCSLFGMVQDVKLQF